MTSLSINPGDAQLYINGLKDKLENAQCAYEIAKAQRDSAASEYSNAEEWTKLLKTYWERIDVTSELANAILNEITNTESQVNKVGASLEASSNAVKIMILATKSVCECTEDIKEIVARLLYQISCLNLPDLNQRNNILVCINDLNKALDEALTAARIAIQKSLDVLECTGVLDEMFNGTNGTKYFLTQLDSLLRKGFKSGLNDDLLKSLGDRPKFPINTDNCDYYDYIKCEHKDALVAMEGSDGNGGAKKVLADKNNLLSLAQSKRDAIQAGLDAALGAKSC